MLKTYKFIVTLYTGEHGNLFEQRFCHFVMFMIPLNTFTCSAEMSWRLLPNFRLQSSEPFLHSKEQYINDNSNNITFLISEMALTLKISTFITYFHWIQMRSLISCLCLLFNRRKKRKNSNIKISSKTVFLPLAPYFLLWIF